METLNHHIYTSIIYEFKWEICRYLIIKFYWQYKPRSLSLDKCIILLLLYSLFITLFICCVSCYVNNGISYVIKTQFKNKYTSVHICNLGATLGNLGATPGAISLSSMRSHHSLVSGLVGMNCWLIPVKESIWWLLQSYYIMLCTYNMGL